MLESFSNPQGCGVREYISAFDPFHLWFQEANLRLLTASRGMPNLWNIYIQWVQIWRLEELKSCSISVVCTVCCCECCVCFLYPMKRSYSDIRELHKNTLTHTHKKNHKPNTVLRKSWFIYMRGIWIHFPPHDPCLDPEIQLFVYSSVNRLKAL